MNTLSLHYFLSIINKPKKIMKMNAKYFRDTAWSELKGKWGQAALFTFMYMIISGALSALGIMDDLVGGLLSIFVLLPMQYGYDISFLEYARTRENVKIEGIFYGFKNYGCVLLTGLLVGIYTFLWLLLLIVPGIIKALSYSMSFYIVKDNPELSSEECIKRSMEMMDGHKWELFCLGLSFIGWILLGIITLGIGLIWIVPYMSTAYAHFYEYVKDEYEGKRN